MTLNVSQDIEVKEYSIKIRDKLNKKSANPIGVVSVLPELQIRIGMSYKLLLECLKNANIYVFFQQIHHKNGVEIYSLMRIGLNGIGDEPLGAITVYNGIVVSYQFNQRMGPGNTNLSAIQQIRIGGTQENAAKLAVTAISALTKIKITKENWGINMGDSGIQVYYKFDPMCNGKYNLYYYLSQDSTNRYFVNTVGYSMNELKSN